MTRIKLKPPIYRADVTMTDQRKCSVIVWKDDNRDYYTIMFANWFVDVNGNPQCPINKAVSCFRDTSFILNNEHDPVVNPDRIHILHAYHEEKKMAEKLAWWNELADRVNASTLSFEVAFRIANATNKTTREEFLKKLKKGHVPLCGHTGKGEYGKWVNQNHDASKTGADLSLIPLFKTALADLIYADKKTNPKKI